MANALSYTLGLATAGFTGPLSSAKTAMGSFLGVMSNLGNITTGISSAIGLAKGLADALSTPVTMAADMEDLNMSFRSLLKDGGAARALVADLVKFADVTPFEPKPVAEAGKQLLAFGVAAKDIIPMLGDIGDLSAAMNKPLNEVADTFGRLKAGQFGEAFERMRAFGISMQDLLGAGLVFDKGGSFKGSADEAMEAVRGIIRRKFGGGMTDLAGTFNGLFSTMTGYWDALKVKFGEPIMISLKSVIGDMTGMVQEWTPMAAKFGAEIGQAIAGMRNLFQGGNLGATIMQAWPGASQVILQEMQLVGETLIAVVGVGLKGAFQSAMALMSDGNFFDGIKASVMSIAAAVRASLLTTIADAVDRLPQMFRMGANPEGMRDQAKTATEDAGDLQKIANYSFAQVDLGAIVSPLMTAGEELGVVLSAAAGKARDAATNNANLNGAYADMRSASRGDDTAPPVTATNPLLAYRLPDAGRLGGNFATAQGSFDQEKFAAQVASALSPSGYANAGGVDIGKQVSAARVFGDMLAALTKIEGRISAPGGF